MSEQPSKFIEANVRGHVFIASKVLNIKSYERIIFFEKAVLLAVNSLVSKGEYTTAEVSQLIIDQAGMLQTALSKATVVERKKQIEAEQLNTIIKDTEDLLLSASEPLSALTPEPEPDSDLVEQELDPDSDLVEQELDPDSDLVELELDPDSDLVELELDPDSDLVELESELVQPEPEAKPNEVPVVEKPSEPKKQKKKKTIVAKKMEDKLRDERKPLEKILVDDCVHLRLVTKKRAKKLAVELTGRSRKEGEAKIVAELRQTLHDQIRGFIRQNKGGPWKSPRDQDELRLDISATKTLGSLVMLAKQILREREKWEGLNKKSPLQKMFGGKINMKFGND